MTKRIVTGESLRAMAALSGLELSDERLGELLPQVQRALEDIEDMDLPGLAEAEPAHTFRVTRE